MKESKIKENTKAIYLETPTTLRLSVGIEDIEDLKAELKDVLNYDD